MIKRMNLSLLEITKEEYQDLLKEQTPHILLDVRKDDEVCLKKCDDKKFFFRDIVYIEKDNISSDILEKSLSCCRSYHGKDSPIIVLCRRGNRSLFVTCVLKKMGFLNVKSLNCGINGLESG